MFRRALASSVGFVWLLGGIAAYSQNLVTNGGFESPVVNGPYEQRLPGTTFGNWQVDNVGQGIVHIGSFGSPLAIEGAQSVELNWYVSCGVSQTLTTTPGTVYVISFLMAGQLNAGPDVKEMRVDWEGSSLGTISWSRSATGGTWVRHALVATAHSSSAVLHFFGATPANEDGGPYLDDVQVVPCITIVNQPVSTHTCPSTPVMFAVEAAGADTLTYQWQIETAPNVWATLGNDPMPLPCGGFAYALPPGSATTNIGVSPCAGVRDYHVRARVSNSCGEITSAAVTLTIITTADLNCDCNINNFDIDSFVLALTNPAGYHAAFPNCNINHADVNGDGRVDNFDIDPFVRCLTGTCP